MHAAELLGLYLGDGCVSELPRTYSLRIAFDGICPRLIEEATELLARCFPMAGVPTVRVAGARTVIVSVYSGHLTCLFPQDGPGKKHDRGIVLEPWQRAIVERAPCGSTGGKASPR